MRFPKKFFTVIAVLLAVTIFAEVTGLIFTLYKMSLVGNVFMIVGGAVFLAVIIMTVITFTIAKKISRSEEKPEKEDAENGGDNELQEKK